MKVDVFYRAYHRDPQRMMSARNVREWGFDAPDDATLEDLLRLSTIPIHRQVGIFEIQTDRGVYSTTDGMAIDPTTRTGRARIVFRTWDEIEKLEATGEIEPLPPPAPEPDEDNTMYVKGKGRVPARRVGQLRIGDTVGYRGLHGPVIGLRETGPKKVALTIDANGYTMTWPIYKSTRVNFLPSTALDRFIAIWRSRLPPEQADRFKAFVSRNRDMIRSGVEGLGR